MKTIVSVTPLQLVADSRTFKMAASFARFGYLSIVVEGLRSDVQHKNLPFSLVHVKGDVIFSNTNATSRGPKHSSRSILEWCKNWLVRLSKPFSNQFRTFFSLPEASLYYLHSFYLFPAVYVKCKLLNAPFIYDAHDYYQAENPGKLKKWVEKICIKRAAAFVTVSTGVAGIFLKEYGRDPVVIRNCHDSRLETEPDLNLRQSLGLSSNDFLIVVVGQAKDGMAVEEAIEAMAALPPHVHLAFVGKNSQTYSGLVERAQLSSRVHLVPPVLPSQVVPFIRSSDAAMIIYYSRTANYENCLPNGFFQSISAQLPVLYPKLPEINQLADMFKIGLPIDVRSPHDIGRGIVQILDGDGVHFKSGLVRASLDLSWEREEKILHTVVEDILSYPSKRQR